MEKRDTEIGEGADMLLMSRSRALHMRELRSSHKPETQRIGPLPIRICTE